MIGKIYARRVNWDAYRPEFLEIDVACELGTTNKIPEKEKPE
jgi:hypothetical protein